MTHRKDLLKQGFRHGLFGPKAKLQRAAKRAKASGEITHFRIVPYNKSLHEVYVKKLTKK